MKNNEKAVSTIVGGFIMISALFGFTTYVLVHKARQGQMRARGLIDVMEDAEKRQAQLIDISYTEEKGGDLLVYLSNYGWEDAKVEKVWVDGDSVSDWGVYRAGDDSSLDNTIPSREFVYVEVNGEAGGGRHVFAFLTGSNSVYKWEVP